MPRNIIRCKGRQYMSLLFRGSLIIFVLATIIYGLTEWRNANQKTTDIISGELTPDFIAESLKSAIYNQAGRLSHEIEASRMEHYTELEFTQFELPNYTLYPKNSNSPWQVKAKEATLYNNNRVILTNTVRITSTEPDALIQKVHSRALELDLNTNIISSVEEVIVYGKNFTMYGSGLIIDLNTTKMTLTQHEKTTYKKNKS